ncbi:5'-methylthioadenosine/S-adenosylhomocysteine nucleosidase [Thermotoga profunda]|uniref:5'-methylthioadenosine/S-adenosylhomocysteine nucleosidase n=1 Tax=Thermotoga profunda TaxID=1508420 RepID=UPI00059723BD|nr:5'-methylthioadenosine/S-adenosylhomocysteine nucleosidase [Thermotoga profunda]
MIAAVGVLPQEIMPLVDGLTHRLENAELIRRPVIRGVIGSNEIIITSGCVGKIETAALIQSLIDHYKVDAIVVLGAAGALRNDLSIGSIVAGSGYIEYDFTPRVNLDLILEPRQSCFSDFLEKNDFISGLIASGDRFITTDVEAKKIFESTSALCVDMDSAAAAKVCIENDVEFLSLKVIVDIAGSRAIEQYIENHQKFGSKPAITLLEYLSNNRFICGGER